MPSHNAEHDWLDGSLYPDRETPEQLATLEERIDFLARLFASWDFGILPEQKTVDEIRRHEWREAVDLCRLLTSPTYHMLREWHELKRLPYLGQQLAYIRDDPCLERIQIALFSHIQNELRSFVGLAFERLAQQWIVQQAHAGALPFSPEAVGVTGTVGF